jgi:hypothetical protein
MFGVRTPQHLWWHDTVVLGLLSIGVRKIRKDLLSAWMIPANIGPDTTRPSILVEFVLSLVSKVSGAVVGEHRD